MGGEWTGRPITVEQYDATMRRHGTADWTSEDNRIMNEYQQYHNVGKYAPEAGPSDESTRDGWEQDEDAARNQVVGDERQVNAESTGDVSQSPEQQDAETEQVDESQLTGTEADDRRNAEAEQGAAAETPEPATRSTRKHK